MKRTCLLLALLLAFACVLPKAQAEKALTEIQTKKLISEYLISTDENRREEILSALASGPALTKKDAAKWAKELPEIAKKALTAEYSKKLGKDFEKFAKGGVFEMEADGLKMKYFYRTGGKAGKSGYALYINLHGGGNDAATNDSAWESAKGQYSVDGCLFVPRAPKDEVLSWAIPEMYPLLNDLLKEAFALRSIDSDRVYVLGYSMGGWGTLLLGPAFADRFAAVGSSAGGEHVQRANPQNLYNTPIIIQIGTEDHAFQRYELSKAFGERLAELHKAEPKGYKHEYREHKGMGHQIPDSDNPKWMSSHVRDPYPAKVVWHHVEVPGWDNDRFYYVKVERPSGAVVELDMQGGTFTILKRTGGGKLTILLNDDMADLDKPVTVTQDGTRLFEGTVTRSLVTMVESFGERWDRSGTFCAKVEME